MDRPPDRSPEKPVSEGSAASVPARRTIPRLPVLIGIIGLGAVVTTGSWFKRQSTVQQRAQVQAVQTEVASLRQKSGEYRARFANLRWNAKKIRAGADATEAEPLKTWARERVSRFATLVATIDRTAADERFIRGAGEVEALCARGEIEEARRRLGQLEPASFPTPAQFKELQGEMYLKPLAEFSRQNPTYFRALNACEPEAARAEIASLRAQLESQDMEKLTPQSLVMVELLSAVTPESDPLLTEWAAVVSAADFFEEPDPETLQRWREAKRAIQLGEWQTAAARMQAIARSTVRTRQPFRAAYGRAILKNRPDQTEEAYPFMEEAAKAGDREARAWVAGEDLARGRHAQALGWLEAMVTDGESSAVPQLLTLYAMGREALARDWTRQAGMLERIIVAPDAPPLASLLLARQYENGQGITSSLEKAFVCFAQAAEKKSVEAWAQVARCHLHGRGTPVNIDEARDWAVRAYAAGERRDSVPLLLELMERAPDGTALAVQELLAHEQIAGPAGFQMTRVEGTSVSQLRMQVAKHLDQRGSFGAAARLYAQSGSHDAAAAHRHSELTMANPCEACAGVGKIQTSVPCPTCSGKGTVTCGGCEGRGYRLIPGTPPCPTCGGSGGMMQEGRRATCSGCAGTGKGKGSVLKQSCRLCANGKAVCRDGVSGRLKLTKACTACRGIGSRALADP